jgi:uncharacterized protein (TIGR02246 family)
MRCVAPLCSVVLLFAAACAPKGETAVKDSAATAAPPVMDAAAVRQAIEQSNAKFVDAIKRGDTTAMAADYADDAVMMMGGMPALRGRSEITKAVTGMSQSMKGGDLKLTTSQVDLGGDYAIETGTYEMTATPPGGKPTTEKGKYVVVWKKQPDGSWKIYRDIANTDAPPPKG